jgi:hypothetical protein
MAFGAKRDQVFFGIVPGLAAKLLVVDFEVRERAANLAPPSIPPQDLLTEVFISGGIEAHRFKFQKTQRY